jgi:hypothetical protein
MKEHRESVGLSNQRNFKRIDSDSVVEILFNGDAPNLRVHFKDWSVAGACLMMDGPVLLPMRFFIRKPQNGDDAPIVACEIIWRQNEDVGVRFLRTPSED